MRRLTNLKLREVSSVDDPANKGAVVVLFKRDGAPVGEAPGGGAAALKPCAECKTPQNCKANGRCAMAGKTMQKFLSGLGNAFGALTGGNEAAQAQVTKALAEMETALGSEAEGEGDISKDKTIVEDLQKQFGALMAMGATDRAAMDLLPEAARPDFIKADAAGRTAIIAKHKAPATVADPEVALLKGTLATMQTQIDAVTKANELLVANANAVELRKSAEAVKLAYPETEALVDLLKTLPDDKRKTLLATLTKSQAALAASPLFSEIGTTEPGDTSDPYNQLLAKAAELRKADPKMSEAVAFDKAYTDPANRAIVTAYKSNPRLVPMSRRN